MQRFSFMVVSVVCRLVVLNVIVCAPYSNRRECCLRQHVNRGGFTSPFHYRKHSLDASFTLQAFQVNSIDYLLKPINIDDLHRALDKLRQRTASPSSNDDLRRALEMLSQHYRQYKKFFLIPVRDKLVPLAVEQIACIYLDNKNSVALTVDGHTHPLDKPLEQIAAQLDPRRFFRVNRQYIVAHDAIKDISVWLLGKYSIRLTVETPERIVLPKAKVSEFKDWYCQ